ncbi:wall-associated receptor kinase-like 10 [Pistacia vera]|uniref:wall-associated receptor kinase-like 10 n=1 Tax=Pistacia vera TaxID=55513 RepID=UPI0012636828|nr:wall-associated receptor kinase-like 10 [Pistacia vera]
MILRLLFQIIFLSWPMISRTQAQALVKPGCPSKCGNVPIPFPFGIGEGCYIDDWFAIDCDSSNKPFIKKIHLEVLEISLKAESPFVFSQESNRFTALGCNNIAYMKVSEFSIVGGCFSTCPDNKTKTGENGCYGIKCCQTKIPSSLKVFNTTIGTFNGGRNRNNITECGYAFLVDQNWFEKNHQNIEKMTQVPVWVIVTAKRATKEILIFTKDVKILINAVPANRVGICFAKTLTEDMVVSHHPAKDLRLTRWR